MNAEPIGDAVPASGFRFEIEIADVGLENWRLAGTTTELEQARCAAIDLAEQGHRVRVCKIRALRVSQQVEIREPETARIFTLRRRIAEDEAELADTRERIAELEARAEDMRRALAELRAEMVALEPGDS